MKKTFFKTFHKSTNTDFILNAIYSSEIQEISEEIVNRRLTETELEQVFLNLSEEFTDERYQIMRSSVEMILNNQFTRNILK